MLTEPRIFPGSASNLSIRYEKFFNLRNYLGRLDGFVIRRMRQAQALERGLLRSFSGDDNDGHILMRTIRAYLLINFRPSIIGILMSVITRSKWFRRVFQPGNSVISLGDNHVFDASQRKNDELTHHRESSTTKQESSDMLPSDISGRFPPKPVLFREFLRAVLQARVGLFPR